MSVTGASETTYGLWRGPEKLRVTGPVVALSGPLSALLKWIGDAKVCNPSIPNLWTPFTVHPKFDLNRFSRYSSANARKIRFGVDFCYRIYIFRFAFGLHVTLLGGPETRIINPRWRTAPFWKRSIHRHILVMVQPIATKFGRVMQIDHLNLKES